MPVGGYILIGVLGLLLAFLAVLHYVSRRSAIQLGLEFLCIGAYFAAVIHFLGPPGVLVPKSPEDDKRFWAAVAALFVFIILGMLAEGLYSWLDKAPTQRRQARDWGGMIKPLFVSPLILIPTVAAFQNANIDLTKLGFPWLMILLTAFEKGFLWRHYLVKRVTDLRETKSQTKKAAGA